jgi:hypothetical protein
MGAIGSRGRRLLKHGADLSTPEFPKLRWMKCF